MIEVARTAERAAYESIVVADHLAIAARVESRCPFNATGRSMLSFLAGATQTIRPKLR